MLKIVCARGQVELKYAESRTEAKALELSTEAHLAQLARREQARPLSKGLGAALGYLNAHLAGAQLAQLVRRKQARRLLRGVRARACTRVCAHAT